MRRAYRNIAILAAVAAVTYGAFRLAPTVALTSASFPDLLEACTEAAVKKSAAPVRGHLPLPVESGLSVARIGTELGPVTLVLTYRPGTGTLHSCGITGDVWRDSASVLDPSVSWSAARPAVEAWFGTRLQQPGHAAPANLTAPSADSLFAIFCPPDGAEGVFLQASPLRRGSETNDVPDGDLPVSVQVFHSANEPGQACVMVAAAPG